jgi:hypothetical protein
MHSGLGALTALSVAPLAASLLEALGLLAVLQVGLFPPGGHSLGGVRWLVARGWFHRPSR